MIVSSLMIYFYSLTMFQLSVTIFLELHKPLVSIDFHSNLVDMISFSFVLNMLVTISLLVVIVPLYQSLIYYKAVPFNPTEFYFYPLLVCFASLADIVPGLKLTLNY